jgi:uncharacterized membrane protein
MEIVRATHDQIEQALGHSPHPAIVALPLGAFVVSNVCDTVGMISGSRAHDEAARISMGIGLVGAAGAALTGLVDYSRIPKDRPSHDVATRHALGNALVGSLFVASYLMRTRDHALRRRPRLLSRLLSLAGGGLSLYTAWLGGVLVEEMGEAVKPVMEEQSHGRESEAGEEDSGHTHDGRIRGRERLARESPLGMHDETH